MTRFNARLCSRVGGAGLSALLVCGAVGPLAATARASSSAGAVYAWLDNDAGQLGIGTIGPQFDSKTPVPSDMPSGTTSTGVAGGQSHSLAVTSTGAVYAFGRNGRGQLGDNTTTNSYVPVRTSIPAGVTVTAVAAGWDQSLALTSTGAVYAWGYNTSGQLGDGTTKQRNAPVLVHLPAGTVATAVAAGQYFSLAVTSTGAAYAWGYNGFGQLGNGTTVNSDVPVRVHLPTGVVATAVGGGDNHSLVVTSTGKVYASGKNTFGQLGDGTTTQSHVPVLVHLPAGVIAKTVAAGGISPTATKPEGDYSVAVTSTGAVYAWGADGIGQLGNNSTKSSTVPVRTQLPAGVAATGIGAGPNYGYAVTSTGDVYYWGAGIDGKHLVPVPTSLPSGLKGASVGAGPDGEQILAIFVP